MMKAILTLLFFILSVSFSFGQVFFKQRVYGMEDREPKEEVSVVRRNKNHNSTSVRRSRTYQHERNPEPSLWKDRPLKAITKKGLFVYTEEGNTYIQVNKASSMFRDMGEVNLANSLSGIGNGYAATTIVQFLSVPSMMLFGGLALGDVVNEEVGSGTKGFRASVGIFVGTTIFKQVLKASLRSTLKNYNSKLSFDKKFAPNFAPSKITFKPAQISPFTPSLAPTLGLSWKL